ncbi:flagellar hook protein FlgE [Parapedomonas caeni]|jgi:flagellar hook protein FlgE
MSLYAALYSGVSGLSANSTALGIISDNITNVNTVGYKASGVDFKTLVTETSSLNAYSPGGVAAKPRNMIGQQGLLQASTSSTDLSIDGAGFFVVRADPNTSGDVMFTRAGSFRPDALGFLQNTAGHYLMGWQLNSGGTFVNNGDVGSLVPINIAGLTGTAEATSSVRVRANLQSSQTAYTGAYAAGDMADGTVTPHFTRNIQVFDAQGGAHTVTMSFLKSANANEWNVEVYGDPTDVNGGLISSGTITFNTDGSLNSTTLPDPVTVDWIGGAADSEISFNFGTPGEVDGLTQFNSVSTMISSNVNGAVFGNVTGVSIGKDGVVTALFDNGLTRAVYKLPIATFQNPDGLQRAQGNAYTVSDYSGQFSLVEAGTGGGGAVAPSTLEASTVDLASEFTRLITTQRAFSAASKVITTADEMLNELNQVKR